MGLLYINTGTSANSGNGDSIRLAFTKVNNNFSKLDTNSSPTFFRVTATNLISSSGMIGTLTISTLSITGQVITPVYFSSSGNFESLTVRQSAQVQSLNVVNTSSFNDVNITGTIYGNLIFNGTATLGDIVISNGVSGLMTFTNINVVENATFSSINNAGTYTGTTITGTTITGITITGNDIFGKTLSLQDDSPISVDLKFKNIDVTGFNAIKMQDPQSGGLNIVRQNIGDDNGNFLAGNTYIYGLTPADTINLGRYSDLNFYASDFNYYVPSAPNTASIQILAFDGRVVLNKDLYLKTSTIYFNSSSFTIDSFGTISINGNTFLSGTAGPTGPIGPTGPASSLVTNQILYTTSTVSFARISSTTATFTSVAGTTVTFTNLTGTTATFTSVVGTTATFTNITGTTATFTSVTGTAVTFTNLTGTTATFTNITGTTATFTSVAGTTATFTRIIGTRIIGTTASFEALSGTPVMGVVGDPFQIGYRGKPQIVLVNNDPFETITNLNIDDQGKHLLTTATYRTRVYLPVTAERNFPIGSEVTIVSLEGPLILEMTSISGIVTPFNSTRFQSITVSTNTVMVTCLKISDTSWFVRY